MVMKFYENVTNHIGEEDQACRAATLVTTFTVLKLEGVSYEKLT